MVCGHDPSFVEKSIFYNPWFSGSRSGGRDVANHKASQPLATEVDYQHGHFGP